MTQKPAVLAPKVLSFAEADALLDGAMSLRFQGSYETVLLFDGDLAVEGDFLPAVAAMTDIEPDLIVISGDLTVNGKIELYEYTPGLFVGGFTQAETLGGGDCEIYIQDGAFTYFIHGYYNDGILKTGAVNVPWVINNDHCLVTTAPDALFVDTYGSAYGRHTEVFVPEVLDKYNAIDVHLFLKRLRAGLPVLLPGAKS
jgi:hypothetical protein